MMKYRTNAVHLDIDKYSMVFIHQVRVLFYKTNSTAVYFALFSFGSSETTVQKMKVSSEIIIVFGNRNIYTRVKMSPSVHGQGKVECRAGNVQMQIGSAA